MRTFYGLNSFLKSTFSSRTFIATIGVFDGFHRAHQEIARKVLQEARRQKLSSLAVTFEPHPRTIINPSRRIPLLITLEHRLRLLGETGFDCAIVLHFTKRLSKMTADDFIRKVIGKIRIKGIIVGRNFFFGRDRVGSLRSLRKFAEDYGYTLEAVNTLKSRQRIISSTWIRNLIMQGELKRAAALLGRPVAVLGSVVRGHKIGRAIGYPTANIDPHHEVIPPTGVYAVRVKLQNRIYDGVLNIGRKPTFEKDYPKEKYPTIEVHIFDFRRLIYKKEIEIIFVERIRPEKKFNDVNSLKTQIIKDGEKARRILRKSPFGTGRYRKGRIFTIPFFYGKI